APERGGPDRPRPMDRRAGPLIMSALAAVLRRRRTRGILRDEDARRRNGRPPRRARGRLRRQPGTARRALGERRTRTEALLQRDDELPRVPRGGEPQGADARRDRRRLPRGGGGRRGEGARALRRVPEGSEGRQAAREAHRLVHGDAVVHVARRRPAPAPRGLPRLSPVRQGELTALATQRTNGASSASFRASLLVESPPTAIAF